MSSIVLGVCVALCLCGATLLGLYIRSLLPGHHLNTESKEVIRLATAIVGTLAALALGLLIASAKTTNDDAETELKSSAAHVVLLDRLMAHYGPETNEARALLRKAIEDRLAREWGSVSNSPTADDEEQQIRDIEAVQNQLRMLTPQTDAQRLLQTRALEISGVVAEAHWLFVETSDEGLPWAFLTVLVFWLALLFVTFGLQAPPNPTLVSILLVCAVCVGGAVFLIVDMANPYLGVIHISEEPLRMALARLGKN